MNMSPLYLCCVVECEMGKQFLLFKMAGEGADRLVGRFAEHKGRLAIHLTILRLGSDLIRSQRGGLRRSDQDDRVVRGKSRIAGGIGLDGRIGECGGLAVRDSAVGCITWSAGLMPIQSFHVIVLTTIGLPNPCGFSPLISRPLRPLMNWPSMVIQKQRIGGHRDDLEIARLDVVGDGLGHRPVGESRPDQHHSFVMIALEHNGVVIELGIGIGVSRVAKTQSHDIIVVRDEMRIGRCDKCRVLDRSPTRRKVGQEMVGEEGQHRPEPDKPPSPPLP